MKSIFIFGAFLAVASALPLDIFEDEEGEEFVLIPVHKQKRDLTWGATQSGASLGQKGTIWSNDNHQIDGSYGASKAWDTHGLKPDSYQGRVDYTHNPSRSTAFVEANKTPGYGTDVSTGVKYNFIQNKDINADITGQYGRHYGGPGGAGKPEAGVFLNVEAKI